MLSTSVVDNEDGQDYIVRAMMIVHSSSPAAHVQEPEEVLAGLRRATVRWRQQEQARPRVTSGVPEVDRLLGGGWPQGKVGELLGPVSSGRTGIAMATVAAATRRGEVAAWVDPADAFDPASAVAAGVVLSRVLWVRPQALEDGVRAAELVLAAGGFTVLVLDAAGERLPLPEPAAGGVGKSSPWGRRRRPRRDTLRLRFARAVEQAGAAALVLAPRPWVGTWAGVTVVLQPGRPRWRQGTATGPRWLAEVALAARLERGVAGRVGGQAAPVLAAVSPLGAAAAGIGEGPCA